MPPNNQHTLISPTPQSASLNCCQHFYEQPWVRAIADNSFHPGGKALTQRTIDTMALNHGATLLDLGCGVGTTSYTLAYGQQQLRVTGVDLSAHNIAYAKQQTNADESPALSPLFVQADAHQLPFKAASFDAVLCECTLSLFTDKPQVLAEIQRVLNAQGRLGITDMVLAGPLAQDLLDVVAPWTCLIDALTIPAYSELFVAAGFTLQQSVDESQSLLDLLAQLKRRLVVLGLGQAVSGGHGLDLAQIHYWIQRFESEIRAGRIGYHRFNLLFGG